MSTLGLWTAIISVHSAESNGTPIGKANQAAAERLQRFILVLTLLKTVLNMAALQDWAVPA